jgi:uncharacterized protein (TIGR03083 family)
MTLDFMAALRRDGTAFAELLDTAELSARVPSCPEWDVAELGYHLSEVYAFWATVVGERRRGEGEVAILARPHDSEVAALFEQQLEHLVSVLEAVPGDTEVWAWWGPAVAADVVRRMAQETAMHLCDLQLALGQQPTIEPELASDAIDELLEWFLPWVAAKWPTEVGGSVHIHCGDVPGEWTLMPDDGGVRVTREHAKGDCALRGTASDLALAVWRRLPLDAVDVVGDRAVAERFVAVLGLD